MELLFNWVECRQSSIHQTSSHGTQSSFFLVNLISFLILGKTLRWFLTSSIINNSVYLIEEDCSRFLLQVQFLRLRNFSALSSVFLWSNFMVYNWWFDCQVWQQKAYHTCNKKVTECLIESSETFSLNFLFSKFLSLGELTKTTE